MAGGGGDVCGHSGGGDRGGGGGCLSQEARQLPLSQRLAAAVLQTVCARLCF